jgi:hypothetical protein
LKKESALLQLWFFGAHEVAVAGLLPSDKMLDVLHFAPEEGIAKKLRSRSGSRYRAFDFNAKLYRFDSLEVEQLDLCYGIDAFSHESVHLISCTTM